MDAWLKEQPKILGAGNVLYMKDMPSEEEIEDIVTEIKLFGKVPTETTVQSELQECKAIAKALHKRIRG